MKDIFPKRISILGDIWKIRIRKCDDDEELAGREIGGYCHAYRNLIVIRDFRGEVEDDVAVAYMRESLRHEIVHAFFRCSGLWQNSSGAESCSMDEQTIDWFAIQSPKIFKVYAECNVL